MVNALSAGRTFCRELGASPTLDLAAAGGSLRMGQAAVTNAGSVVDLQVMADGLPQGSVVRVVQGAIEPGTVELDPSSMTVHTLTADSFASGTSTVLMDNSRSSFARVEVMDVTGRCIAFSNPIWLLVDSAPTPVPLARTPK